MSDTTQPQQQRKDVVSMSSMLSLASWGLHSTWFLLLVIAFGMTGAVVVASAIPLFSTVMTTAGLRSTLRSTPENTEIVLNTAMWGQAIVYGTGLPISTRRTMLFVF